MRRLLALILCLAATAATARVISYAPYTDRNSIPALQSRLNRHFVLNESAPGTYNGGQVVLYDTKGIEEPRVIYPTDPTKVAPVIALAVREDDTQLAILVVTQEASANIWRLSTDAGTTWRALNISPVFSPISNMFGNSVDTGGPFVHGRYSQIRIGTHDKPFVMLTIDPSGGTNMFSIRNDGDVKTLFGFGDSSARLAGGSIDGAQFFVIGRQNALVVGLDSTFRTIPLPPGGTATYNEAWLTQAGQIYLEGTSPSLLASLLFFDGSSWKWIDGPPETQPPSTGTSPVPPPPNTSPTGSFFAVPSADYAGAWTIFKTTASTKLAFSRNGGPAVKQWLDVPASDVEALHPSKSGDKVLIQVHRPRQTLDLITFKDPALAVWHVGDPNPPRAYDELFLEETFLKAFVHLDVDKVESGDPFVFDSGVPQTNGGGVIISPPPPSAGGGSDVTQEWGVVRASLAQRLVLPGAARTGGAFGSYWLTDVTFYNPSTAPVDVTVRYVANGDAIEASSGSSVRTVTLAAREIRTITDVLKNLFEFESGGGALFITPAIGSSVSVTSRTYTKAAKGTFGFGMNAIDVYASASPRFPVTFAGAFLGDNFRTNLVVTDVSGRGSDTMMSAWGSSWVVGDTVLPFHAPSLGQQQVNGIGSYLGVRPSDTGSLIVRPSSGEAVASVFAIDNRTNDATYFPPDIAVSVVRVIPAIGHLAGANGSNFRTDLYLFNNSDTVKYLTLQAKVWDSADGPVAITFTLLPHESRIIPDVLQTMFNKSGIARLRFWQQGAIADTSVRVTSRTYTVGDDGGTYGFLMPPLNSFQSGSAGDTLEILGTSIDPAARTNLGLVDLTPWPSGLQSKAHVDVINNKGDVIDGFDVALNSTSGTQINDLYHSRNLSASSPTPVLLRVTVITGYVGAYASVVDNGTNDPAYFAANLAAKN